MVRQRPCCSPPPPKKKPNFLSFYFWLDCRRRFGRFDRSDGRLLSLFFMGVELTGLVIYTLFPKAFCFFFFFDLPNTNNKKTRKRRRNRERGDFGVAAANYHLLPCLLEAYSVIHYLPRYNINFPWMDGFEMFS